VPDDGATAAKKRRQAVARCVYPVASGPGSAHCGSPRHAFTKKATEPRVYGEVCGYLYRNSLKGGEGSR
jgi:hypothetical protein